MAYAHDNIITSPMCVNNECTHIPSYIVYAETDTDINIDWMNPPGPDYRIDYEIITYEFQGVVVSGSTTTLVATVNIPNVGIFDVRYRICTNVSTAETCAPWELSSQKSLEEHGFIIMTRLKAPGGGGLD